MPSDLSLRKIALTAHIVASVGWLGAVGAFFALSLVGLVDASPKAELATAVSMYLVTWSVIVPLCIASLLTGIISSWISTWGLLRHYWVAIKLLLSLVATAVLAIHLDPIERLARLAAGNAPSADLRQLRILMASASGAALVSLLVMTVLSVYKPKGMTRYGWKKQNALRA